ncbi:hypothetical protein P7K49_012023 [Saguinus oedipus]|uniref:Uncharacterized protein n=1 Tax=Saguinus oedipus TaxID=9490 RepID=A0ABQ9VSB9_SAGOE|nr:hypothetical protein P7K49_012023 [Saguinus oedipus]
MGQGLPLISSGRGQTSWAESPEKRVLTGKPQLTQSLQDSAGCKPVKTEQPQLPLVGQGPLTQPFYSRLLRPFRDCPDGGQLRTQQHFCLLQADICSREHIRKALGHPGPPAPRSLKAQRPKACPRGDSGESAGEGQSPEDHSLDPRTAPRPGSEEQQGKDWQ